MIPFALMPESAGLWVWLGLIVAAFLAGVALMPVRRDVRWAILLLAGLQGPFLYAMKLGRVAPLLFLAFAVGWRAANRAGVLGASIVAGGVIKLQPGLLFGWAVVSGR